MTVVGPGERPSIGGVTLVFSRPSTDEERVVVRGGRRVAHPASKRIAAEERPVAVTFHESERSTASGLRFGWVEILLENEESLARGYMPEPGAMAVARILGVPLVRGGQR